MFDSDTTGLLVTLETSGCLHERSYPLSNEVQPEVKLHLVEAFVFCSWRHRVRIPELRVQLQNHTTDQCALDTHFVACS